MKSLSLYPIVLLLVFSAVISSCSRQTESREEQLSVSHQEIKVDPADTINSIKGNSSLKDLLNQPNKVVLTGLSQHRLVTIYKVVKQKGRQKNDDYYSSYHDYDEDPDVNGAISFFMPGIDLLSGYNLINIAHYDMEQEKLNYLFEQPALIKSLYYPSYVQDSVDEQPINRDYYLISAYDADTNADTLINKHDLRRLYHFNAAGTEKTQLIPSDYSVIRSQYDPKNDAMFIFASHDANKNGTTSEQEPIHIFWLSLKNPQKAKLLY